MTHKSSYRSEKKELNANKAFKLHTYGMLKGAFFSLCFSFYCSPYISAQEIIPLNTDYTISIDNELITGNRNYPTFLKPYNKSSLKNHINIDSTLSFSINMPLEKKGWLIRKWRYESLLRVDSPDFQINADPLFDFCYGRNKDNTTNVFTNSRGLKVWGNLSNEIYFETSFIENQSEFLPYLTDYIHSANVVPGQGQSRRFGSNGFDYSIASGLLSVNFKKYYGLVLGNGKLFAGDGYRSMFLSDNAYNYPYVRFSASFSKWSYSRIMSIIMSDTIPQTSYGLREKRLAGYNIFTYNPCPVFQLSIFEGNIFKYPNDRKSIDFNYSYLNPLIIVNSLVQDKQYSTLLGFSAKLDLCKHFELYNQLAISNLTSNYNLKDKLGFQVGLKYYNALFIDNLFFQVEYNKASEHTYVSSDSLLNYSHFNQALAHPYGNNFKETIIIAKYKYKCWQVGAKWVNASYGIAELGAIPKKTQFVKTIQYETPFISYGPKTDVLNFTISLSYLVNSSTNRKIEAGYVRRDATLLGKDYLGDYFFIAFKTALDNWYYDF
jgi:hypothetical protein